MLQPNLESNRIFLRPFTLEDAPIVQNFVSDKRVAETTAGIAHPYPNGEAKEWISGHAACWEKMDTAHFAIVVSETSELVGAISLMDINHQAAELGYWVGFPHWARGYCTEATITLCNYGFSTLGLNVVIAKYLATNQSSGSVLRKCGFIRTGSETVDWRSSGEATLECYELRHA